VNVANCPGIPPVGFIAMGTETGRWKVAARAGLAAVAALAGGALVAKWRLPVVDSPDSDELALVSIFQANSLRPTSRAFTGGSIVSMFGATTLDLRRVQLHAGRAHLRVVNIYGGTELTVPDTWLVTTTGRSFAGGSAVDVPPGTSADAPVLAITTINLFGGLSVTGRPVLRAAGEQG
jgi:hypothetical protein